MINDRLIGISPNFYEDESLFPLFCDLNIVKNPRHLSTNEVSIADVNYGDITNTYNVNSYGYRSPEFIDNPDIVFLGCSQTFGVGCPEGSTWGAFIAKDLNMSYVNLSTPGWSIQAMVQNFLAYCKKYGNPRNVVALLPDPYRMVLPINREFLSCEQSSNSGKDIVLEDVRLFSGSSKSAKYSKRPHSIDSVLSSEIPFYISMQMLNVLTQYCSSSGIELLWGTWYPSFNNLFKLQSNIDIVDNYPGYVDIDIQVKTFSDCHGDLKRIFGDNFYYGLDCRFGESTPSYETSHMGIHAHRHVADSFINKLNMAN